MLGVGLGGFVDGIVLHQLLQWHHVLSDQADAPLDTVDGLQTNTLADGIFHSGTWLVVFAGTLLAIRAWRRGQLAPPWRAHLGMLLTGWGAFNVIEGIIDHHLLQIHHVRDDLDGPMAWDIGFLVFGAVLAIVGALLHRSATSGS
jgi:uncharacterized membrane protein